MALNILPSEVCGFIPGVRPVKEVIPYMSETDGETTYMVYTDGKVRKMVNGVPKLVEVDIEIFRLSQTASNGKTLTVYEHAKGKWVNRESLTYVPICCPLDADEIRGSNRPF